MTYYKVKPSSDQTRHQMGTKKFNILVANELYTWKVIHNAVKAGRITESFVSQHFETVNINPKKTYWYFGARFESKS